MESRRRELYFISAVLAATVAGGAYFAFRYRAPTPQKFAAHIETWFESPKMTAELMRERYGNPDVLAPGIATWYERGPWKRVTVHGGSPFSYLEQVVGYHVPLDAVVPLREFGHGLSFDVANEELSSTSNSEPSNVLALNLANELASGKITPKEATAIYKRTSETSVAGKSSPYMEKLLFGTYRAVPQEPWNREIGY